MHILITDSGVGGLSVCAYAERFVRSAGLHEPVRLTFVNASPENDFGYNSMGSRDEKLEYFDRFLRIVADRDTPDFIYVACNTLSVLLPDTPFSASGSVPVKGIVETGTEVMLSEIRRLGDPTVIIFGTVTTIESRAYPDRLKAQGISGNRIVSQACPGLADIISEDREGSKAAASIGAFVNAALEKAAPSGAPCLAYLGCTHYGYRQGLFTAAFESAGRPATVLDPNEHAVGDIFGSVEVSAARGTTDVEVEVVSRYRIPDAAMDALAFYLGDISPKTVHALKNFAHEPELF